MAEENCAICGGDLVEEEVKEDIEGKIRDRSPAVEEEDDLHALVCDDCGHVSYRRS